MKMPLEFSKQQSIQPLIYAIRYKDFTNLTTKLRKLKLNSAMFIELCKTAIDCNSINILEFLLDAYYQFWKQPVFNAIINYIIEKKNRDNFFGFIDNYIDKVNTIRSQSPMKDV